MLGRLLKNRLQELLNRYPAVALLGPRQCGKTTLARTVPGRYFDLEREQDCLRLDVEWDALASTADLVILDEAQTVPELFPRLRSAIDDERSRDGRFLLLGSVSPALMTQVGQALTGRLALCELTPLLLHESQGAPDVLWKTGGYPDGGVLQASHFSEWQRNYLELMSQRDLPNWGLTASPVLTVRLFRMLAAVNGQLWNASQIGKSLGLSYHTVNTYVDFLEQAYLVRKLPAYSTNIRKRIVKSPKVYWRDSGLLHSLLDVGYADDLLDRPWIGASWEGWIIEQLLSHLGSTGRAYQAYHLRTSDQREIDLLLELGGELWAFDIKLSSVPGAADLQRLRKTADLIGADRCVLVSRTNTQVVSKDLASVDLEGALELLLKRA